MNFEFSEEQTMLRESLSRFLRDKYDFDTRSKIIASEQGWSPELWAQLAEMGLMAAAFPEEFDGFGGAAADMLVIMEEFGKALVVEPYLPTVVLCGQVLRAVAGAREKELIDRIIAGDLVMALGHGEPRSRYTLSYVETTAKRDGDAYVLNGRKAVVLAAPLAEKIIISARTSGATTDQHGISLFLVDRTQDGVRIDGYPTIDGHQAGDVHLENVTVSADDLIGAEDKAYDLIETVFDTAITAVCAEAAGLCRRMHELTNEYTRNREQFGVPISKFQVLQHNMVDMLIYTEEMTSMAYMAAMKADTEGHDTRQAASAAKVQLGKSCKFVGETSIQLHGGMGITEEMAVGHYFMRATMLGQLFGDLDHHIKRYQALTAQAA